MKPSLQLRLSQQLALTPQLQQSIRLLQLSTLELNQELEQILADNPLLERLDDPLEACLRIAPNGGLENGGAPAPAPAESASGGDDGGEPREFSADTPERFEGDVDDRFGEWSGDGGSRNRNGEDDEREFPQVAATSGSLRDHLLGQLAGTTGSQRDRALVTVLIDELSEDGYLLSTLEDVAASLPAELEIETAELNGALNMLQSFDPPGVGARDVAECLDLQLRALPARIGGEVDPEVLALARAVVRDHLALLATKDFARLKRSLRCDDNRLREVQAMIVGLNPRPGSAFATTEAAYVVPDIVVRRTRAGWTAHLNPDVMPKLRINDMYAQILRRNRGNGGGLSAQLQEARWLIKNVQQRFDTILRVAQAIVDRQRAFFSHGEVAMRPLVLREIADALGLHESTVSRVTTQKFMLTPYGTFELKFFFGSHVATESGGAASSTAIRALIKQLVSAEDPKQPLSDSRIAEVLGEQGIVVARRTVAKYREALRIPAVAQRKSL